MRAVACADGAVRRLSAEFAGVHSRATVAAVVAEAVRHLSGQASPAALPELLERLARHRLDTGVPAAAAATRPRPAAAVACRPALPARRS